MNYPPSMMAGMNITVSDCVDQPFFEDSIRPIYAKKRRAAEIPDAKKRRAAEIPDDYDVQIKQLRLRLGLTQIEFAKLIGTCDQTVCLWENRKTIPRKLAWQKILQNL